MFVPQVSIAVVVGFLFLQNEPVNTSPLLLLPLHFAAAIVIISASVIAIFLILRVLIPLVNEK